jgi:hypothetical protein
MMMATDLPTHPHNRDLLYLTLEQPNSHELLTKLRLSLAQPEKWEPLTEGDRPQEEGTPDLNQASEIAE